MRYILVLLIFLFDLPVVQAASQFSDNEIRAHTRVLDIHCPSSNEVGQILF